MTLTRTAWRGWTLETRLGVLAGLAAIVFSILVLDPLGAATIDPDASSSVLYFDRIVSGHRLEAFVPTTPKPLLTVAFGLTWVLLHDWRALVWETILVWGLAAGATAAFVARVASRVADPRAPAGGASAAVSGVAAATFATAALLGSSDLVLEVSRANSLVWALAGWSIAGLAATARPARPRLAGFALLIAGLCRFETLALAAIAVLVVLVWRMASRATVVGAVLAIAAVPIAMLHDWLLSGDPFYFLSVASRYTAIFNPGLQAIGPLAYAGTLLGHIAPEWPLLLLAAIGFVALVRTRQWLPLAGVVAIGAGIVVLLFWLAYRATYISNRYYEPIDLALIVTAAVGAGWLAARLPASRPAIAPLAGVAAVTAGLAVMWPALPWDRRATAELTDVRAASGHLDLVRPDLARLLDSGVTGLLVPSRDVSRVSLETDEPLDRIINSYAFLLNGGVAALRPGQVVFHDGAADRPAALYRPLEIAAESPLGGNILVRLDPRAAGIWLLSIR